MFMLNTPGQKLLSNRGAQSVVVTSPCNMFRIHTVKSTPMGIELTKHFNISIPGIILHSCLSEVTTEYSDNYHTLFIANFTSSNRLKYNIFMWNLNEGIPQSLRRYSLLMDNTTTIPIMVESLPNNLAYLAICKTSLIIIGIDNITSANYEFKSIPYTGGFPTASYIPQSKIRSSNSSRGPKSDEVIFTTVDGTVYSFVINGLEDITLEPIARIPDSVSVFTFERENKDNSIVMSFGSSTGSNRKIQINKLLHEDDNDDKTPFNTIIDYKNWSPLSHVQLLANSEDPEADNLTTLKHEIWAISGRGKRSRLLQVRNGFSASRLSNCYLKLKKCLRISVVEWEDKILLACSLPFETIFLEYMADQEECFAELIDETLPVANETLGFGVANDKRHAMIFKPTSVVLTNFQDIFETILLEDNWTFLFVQFLANSDSVYNIRQKTQSEETVFTLVKMKGIIVDNALATEVSVNLTFQPSCLYTTTLQGKQYVLVGDYEGKIWIFDGNLSPTVTSTPISLQDINRVATNESILDFKPGEHVPHDIMIIPFENDHFKLIITTKAGYFVSISLNLELGGSTLDEVMRVDGVPVNLLPVPKNPKAVLLVSLKTWIVNNNEQNGRVHPVYFDERKERTIKLACAVPGNLNTYFYVRDDGLCVAEVVPLSKPNVRQATVGEEVKSLVYHENSGLFTVICHLNPKKLSSVLKFIDKRYLKLLPSEEVPYKGTTNIFTPDITVICTCVWNIMKENKEVVSKRLILVGCSDSKGKGMVKVLDIAKIYKEDTNTVVKVTELFCYTLLEVPSHIIQVRGQIFYSGKKQLYSIDYDPERKSFVHNDEVVKLPSDISSLYTDEGSGLAVLYVTTTEDSVFEYEVVDHKLKQSSHDTFKRSVTNVAVMDRSNIFMGEFDSSLVVNIVKEKSFLRTTWSYTFPFIPKVYTTKVSFGRSKDRNRGILCVGVDGTIVVLHSVSTKSNTIKALNNQIGESDLKSKLTERIADTFNYPILPSRNMGRGLLVLNKPCFDFEGNSSKLIDCDIEQINQLCSSIDF
ncbi:uncharacterized protein KQ657_003096 [Scheffersomyces spartinae]|uniref:Cleavage/polyadenylation specificity factor A subunit N-terminal domain-containing protein n=1 Tax=Scheffersomyces spartinae TaxID=45513 RepID=A0A9P8AGE8_9ASCO|nr:uncharacterized protein KQ657_003096 [Scheffersomyces spartinae]KAG7191501.1 hypothetical protein KQ657_003096 [Scheffersomyces spartinae]